MASRVPSSCQADGVHGVPASDSGHDGLVVVRRHVERQVADDPGEEAARDRLDVVRGVQPRRRRVRLVTDPVRDVLLEDAPGRDGHHLHPAADAEDRQVDLLGGPHEGDLPGVAVGALGLRGRVRRGAVEARSDVRSPRHDEPVDAREDLARHVRRDVPARREHDGQTADGLHLGDVGVRQHDAALTDPREAVDLLDVAGDPDDRPGGGHDGPQRGVT